MTTPNIKALAEQIKKNYEAQPDWAEHKIENVSYQLASALLRVLEDANRLHRSLKIRHSPQTCMHDDELLGETCLCCEALESHNKLMSELGQTPNRQEELGQ